ncbi:ATP-dependent metallopeptidase FtsH/Yme1/Tma family protein [Candidatus Phytoplasma pruni]|uniref:ATP-dependent zinc metalloprotease FtsH n=1 Tax=Candidatus Phytoplasma pruni TaxID=479893 RepID=A0A851HJF0_9MOLU|nr:AAA family ATPase [Candidatus Phytoplasma pruni]NWN45676.1 ATP-dependent zinc metalloprotease FtsH [Candidatus Phytoplasma pruni]
MNHLRLKKFYRRHLKKIWFCFILSWLFFLNSYFNIGKWNLDKEKEIPLSEARTKIYDKNVFKIKYNKVDSINPQGEPFYKTYTYYKLAAYDKNDQLLFNVNLDNISVFINNFPKDKKTYVYDVNLLSWFIGLFNYLLSKIHIFSSSIWIFYILSVVRSSKGKLDKDPKVSSSQKSLFTFKDVAGNEEEQEEMKELIDFLKRPKKYKDMGASIPKGVLLSGPPGTGKTLLAKAVAGEAGVPFYSVTGADFKNQYFGVGAARMRKLFQEIRENAPCVLFIDEIDTIGKKRGSIANDDGSTINQLLTEMDGFTESYGIIVMAATNRLDMLDSALLRPGRFDRQFTVGLPDVKAREAILKVHARNKKLSTDINFHQLAKQTSGMSGAELASVLNEASILTVRNQKEWTTMDELQEAIDRVWMGPAKKSRKYSEEEKRETAYHEAGHAVIALKVKDAPKIQKITIVPRGHAGGYVLFMEEKELFFQSKKRLQADIICSLAGRAAEEMMFGDENISNGCYSDFKSATNKARLMVTKYGMSPLGQVQDSEFSDKKAVDIEIKKIIDTSYKKAQEILQENKALLDKIADILLKQETINKEELDQLVQEEK